MASARSKYLSIRMTELLMKYIGLWYPNSPRQKTILDGFLAYTLFLMIVAGIVEALEFVHSLENVLEMTYTACSVMPVLIVWVKLSMFLLKKKIVVNMIKYTQENFWALEYDAYGIKVLKDVNKKSLLLTLTFIIFVNGAVIPTYLFLPLFENRGKNETDRILPFTIHIDALPTTTTPYYEGLYVLEVFSGLHVGVCFCTFDTFMFLMIMHAAGQFKILQNRIRGLYKSVESVDYPSVKEKYNLYEEFKECIIKHYSLIDYAEKLEGIFKYAILFQILISSMMICVAGFQMFVGRASVGRQVIFVAHTIAGFAQLLIFTLTADELMQQSGGIALAAYGADWQSAPSENDEKMVKDGLLMVMKRSYRPCCMTAGGFFPVSIETFTSVVSTAASYFALLRNFELDEGDD